MSEVLISYIQNQLLGGRNEIEISPEDDLLGSGLIDSMGMMSLIAFIEKEFKFKVPPEDMVIEHFITVEAISAYIAQTK